LIGVEALIRWQPKEGPLVSPASFIPVAEDSGLIVPIGHWVLHTACRQIAAWQSDEALRELTVAVNISAKQFHYDDLVAAVHEALRVSGAPPERLKLEITEGLLLEDVEQVIDTMNQLRSIGVQFSIDDFGTGYSSLSYLKRLPLQQLKIDQSFVRDIPHDPENCAIVAAIIAMGKSLGIQVIAEGVETIEQKNFLASHGCHAYQGYFFGRPQPAATLGLR
jgi:EAL domain-containing protein (putative c-di-GMP-specific phosphodiesterase class I)